MQGPGKRHLGQEDKAHSYPVTIASDQDVLDVSDSASQGKLDTVITSLTEIDGNTDALDTQFTDLSNKLTSVETAITGLQKAEDAASSNGDLGVPILGVRRGTPSNSSGTDGDYEMLQVSNGKLWVDGSSVTQPVSDASGSITVDGFGSSTTMQNAATGTGNGTEVAMAGFGSIALQVTGTFSATIIVEGSANGGTTYSTLWVKSANNINIFSTITSTGLYFVQCPGCTHVRARISAYTSGSVTVVGNTYVFPGTDVGTTANISLIRGSTLVEGGVSGSLGVGGSVAHNVAIGTNPINLGAKGVTSEPSAITADRMCQLISDSYGKLIVSPYANRENFVRGVASTTSTSSTLCVAAAGAGLKNYITSIVLFNNGASNVLVTIQDGSGGTTLLQCGVPGSGNNCIVLNFNVPIASSANTAVYFQSNGSVTTLYVSMIGYKGA